MLTAHHRDRPCSDSFVRCDLPCSNPIVGPENAYPARGVDRGYTVFKSRNLGEKRPTYIKHRKTSSLCKAASAPVPCENCAGQGGWLDVSDEDERGPIYDWFLCPQCYGTGDYEPEPRLIALEDFEECFGWH